MGDPAPAGEPKDSGGLGGSDATFPTPALREAARRVLAGAAPGVDRVWLEGALGALSAYASAETGSPGLLAGAQMEPAAARRVIREWRRELIGVWGETPPSDAREMVRVLAGLERAERLLGGQPDGEAEVEPGHACAEVIADFVHDLRSPLSSIVFLAEALQSGRSGGVNALQRRQLGVIYSATLSLVSMASDVIELVGEGDRIIQDRRAPFSVRELLDSIHDMMAPMLVGRPVSLRLVPPEVDRRLGNAVALSRVLLNLITNAIKFTDEGTVDVLVRATGPASLEFAVWNPGPPLDPSALSALARPLTGNPLDHLFGRKGNGLGLAICRKLLHAMHSRLEYESAADHGTRFHFELDLPPLDP